MQLTYEMALRILEIEKEKDQIVSTMNKEKYLGTWYDLVSRAEGFIDGKKELSIHSSFNTMGGN
jgi:hypothetical protein